MELKRIEEDALEYGKTLDEDFLADLRARAEEEKKARRGAKKDEAKPLSEREKRRLSRASMPLPGTGPPEERSTRRKSVLTRTLDLMELTKSASTRSLSSAATTSAVADAPEAKDEKRKSGLFRQSTLSFPSLSNKSTSALISSSSLAVNSADGEESQILLSEKGERKDAKGGLRRSLSSSSKKLLGSVRGSVRRGTKGKENEKEVARERDGSMMTVGSE